MSPWFITVHCRLQTTDCRLPPGQGGGEAPCEAPEPCSLPDLGGDLHQTKGRPHLLLDLHHLNRADDEGPDGARHDSVPGDLHVGEVAEVPAHDSVHTESDCVGESDGAERSVEATVEPQKLT